MSTEYFACRSALLLKPDEIIAIEKKYMDFLVATLISIVDDLYRDFENANDLLPF